MLQGIDDRIPRVVYTITEAAHVLTVSPSTIRRAIERGELRPLHIGRSIRIPVIVIEEYVRSGELPKAS